MAETKKIEYVDCDIDGHDRFNRTWGGHRFSDEEVERLRAGETIEIEWTARSGSRFRGSGKLEEYTWQRPDGTERTTFGFHADSSTFENLSEGSD